MPVNWENRLLAHDFSFVCVINVCVCVLFTNSDQNCRQDKTIGLFKGVKLTTYYFRMSVSHTTKELVLSLMQWSVAVCSVANLSGGKRKTKD